MSTAGTQTIHAGETQLPPKKQRGVQIFERIALQSGHPLQPANGPVLDFGAGAGRHVAAFRAAGYDAFGVDQSFESHSAGSSSEEFLRRVSPPDYRIPFPDAHFAFVYSTAVMEHVLDPGQALAEIARVLRPDGLSIHVFPSRWRPLEAHTRVPFGGRFDSFMFLRLWAALGIRNPWQRHLTATDVALSNAQFAKTGTSYPTGTEWRLRAARSFRTVTWGEGHFIEASRDISPVSARLAPVAYSPIVQWLYRGLHTRVLVLQAPITQGNADPGSSV